MKPHVRNRNRSVLPRNRAARSSCAGHQVGVFVRTLMAVVLTLGVLPALSFAAGVTGAYRNTPRFSHSREITNPYLPLRSLKQDILEGKEGGKTMRVERTAKPNVRKTFKIGDQTVEAFAVEDRDFENGQLTEVTLDYFAQADDGTVYYLGEQVDEYKNGKIVGHEGAWLLGVHTQTPGILMPAHPKVGDKFRSEDVPKVTTEDDEVISVSESVKVPAGSFQNCVKVKEKLSDGTIEYKYYAPGVGVVKEVPERGELLLKSHATTKETGTTAPSTTASADPPPLDPTARDALSLVGVDPEAEAYWLDAINDSSLSAEERSNLIEDLNEDGLSDPKHPTMADLPVIMNRLWLLEEIAWDPMDKTNADAFQEAYKDLINLADVAQGRGEPVR